MVAYIAIILTIHTIVGICAITLQVKYARYSRKAYEKEVAERNKFFSDIEKEMNDEK